MLVPFRGSALLIGCRAGWAGAGGLRAPLSAMAAAAAPPGPGLPLDPGLEPVLREALAALGRPGGGEGLTAALGAVLTALAAVGGPGALGKRERALFGAFLRSLARAPGAARPEGVWQRCFLEGPPDLVLCVLLEALGSAGSVLLPGAGRWAGIRSAGGLGFPRPVSARSSDVCGCLSAGLKGARGWRCG